MLYDLHAFTGSEDETIYQNEKWLLKEILGYNENEAERIAYDCISIIAVKLSSEQVELIVPPFSANGMIIYATNSANGDIVPFKDIYDIYTVKVIKKAHYYDKPVVEREHLIDPFSPEEIPTPEVVQKRPVVECPYCHGRNVKKITYLDRKISIFFSGLASDKINKSFQCNNCGGTF